MTDVKVMDEHTVRRIQEMIDSDSTPIRFIDRPGRVDKHKKYAAIFCRSDVGPCFGELGEDIWIKPENLGVVKGVFNSSLLEKAEYHIKKMDDLRTPGGMLDEFGIGVQLINSMFIFMLNQRQAEAGELLPLIIYGIINCKPKRMIFNINFIKYFMGKNQELGNVGYNLTQAESSTYYIQNLNHKQLQMDEQEFNKRCDECMNSKRIKQNKSINDDSDYD